MDSKMQEFLLYSQIPAAREHQVLSILAGFTGTQPVAVCEQVLLYAQIKVAEAPMAGKRGAAAARNQQQAVAAARPHYHKLIRAVNHARNDATTTTAALAEPWILRVDQVPEPGTKELLSRAATAQPASPEDLSRLSNPQLYRYRTQYLARGNRFVHENLVIRVYQLLVAQQQGDSGDVAGDNKAPWEAPPPTTPDDARWRSLDPSGSWIVEVAIRVADSSNAELTGRATDELLAFKTEMAGAIELFMPDRLALDTRVKGV